MPFLLDTYWMLGLLFLNLPKSVRKKFSCLGTSSIYGKFVLYLSINWAILIQLNKL